MEETEGIWALIERDYYSNIKRVFPGTPEGEVDALRIAVAQGWGSVVFIPWGKSYDEVEEA